MRDINEIAGYIVTYALIAGCIGLAWALVYPLIVMMMAAI